MKILVDKTLQGFVAWDTDSYDGAEDATGNSRLMGHGTIREWALQELAAQWDQDWTPEQVDALIRASDADATTREFLGYVRELVS